MRVLECILLHACVFIVLVLELKERRRGGMWYEEEEEEVEG